MHEEIVGPGRCHWGLLGLRVGYEEVVSHTIESEVSAPEANPAPARLCVDPAAPGAKTTIAAAPTSANPARKRLMMRTGSPLTELLGQSTWNVMDAVEAPNPMPIRWI